eukprot:jgi/Bigna1/129594/aug1.9_g4302
MAAQASVARFVRIVSSRSPFRIRRRELLTAAVGSTLCSLLVTPTLSSSSLAAPGDDTREQAERMFASGKETSEEIAPMAGALTLGGITGYCTGATVRVFGRGASILFGISFIGLQTASYYGFVTVHWEKIEEAFLKSADLDGDGAVDEKDLNIWVTSILSRSAT